MPGIRCDRRRAEKRFRTGCGKTGSKDRPEAFYAEHGTYGGADISALRRDYDSGIDPSVKLGWVENGRYCLESTVDGQTASVTGPGGEVVLGGC